jgi:hypothetical protein
MCEVKANQVYGDATVVSVRKANSREQRDMALQFEAAHRAGYDSQGRVVLYREDGSNLVEAMTLGGFIRQYGVE